ncbi:MAG: class I SAM-dependent methyltransferase [Acidobacteriota bacterium]|nr:class I SAM-dependent methyltransferase [Acidobacteriota bacterium]
MNVRQYAHQARKRFYRQFYLSHLDSIVSVRGRHSDFTRVRDLIRESGTDSLSHFGNGYTHEGGLLLQQNPDEFAALTLFLRERAPHENYMEIGSASGGACLFLYREVGFTNVLSLDDGMHPRAVAQKEHFGQIRNFKQFLGDSHSEEARRFLSENLKGSLDVAFIDGDHSYEGVWQDIELTLPFCRKGTLVILHDTVACEGVESAWLRCTKEKLLRPLAEFIGGEKPLGIAVGEVA